MGEEVVSKQDMFCPNCGHKNKVKWVKGHVEGYYYGLEMTCGGCDVPIICEDESPVEQIGVVSILWR